MFPVNNGVGAAKALCNGSLKSPPCAFRNTCLRYAIDRVEDHGVWGGTSERERRRIQRARKKFNNPFIYSSEDIAHPNVVYIKRRSSVYIKRRTIKRVA
jgi:putative component of membrane protein insertase Oxa1/YidC/SpoIIIJ protein YidD